MSIHPTGDVISDQIVKNGCWECEHVKALEKAMVQYPNAYFLDVGGNIGMWTLSVAAMKRMTFTIEPSRQNYERICKSVNKNGFHRHTHILNVAATETPQQLLLHVPRGNFGGTSVTSASSGSSSENMIQGVPIDSLGLPTDHPIVLKIDVEGAEMDALAGGLTFFEQVPIVYAAMELRNGKLLRHVKTREIFRIFTSKGLRPFRINDSDETPLDPNNLSMWVHSKHPKVMYFDVVWRHPTINEH